MIRKKIRKYLIQSGRMGRKLLFVRDYVHYYGTFPHLKHPVTIGEKIQWIKLNYENPLYTRCVDKVTAREYVREKLGAAYSESLFPIIWQIYDRPEEIVLSRLPDRFVLKPNHSSGKFLICRDKRKLEQQEVIRLAREWVEENFYYVGGEWQYRDIRPRIICEELLEEDIADYRIYCFSGRPGVVKVTRHDRTAESGYAANYYDTAWKELGCCNKDDRKGDFACPCKWKEMLEIAEKLSEDFFFVRVDLYEVGEKIYFGELTFTPNNGMIDLVPNRFNRILGDMIELPHTAAPNHPGRNSDGRYPGR